jgi:2-keto-myo-inositol isomerase
MNRSQLAVNAVSVKGPFEEKLAAFQAAGFRNVEMVIPEVKRYMANTGQTVADVRRRLDQHHLRCIGGFETHLCAFSAPDECAKNHELLAANARLLADLGGTTMVVGTDGGGKDFSKIENPLGILVDAFADFSRLIKDTGVTICLEFNWSPIVKSLRTAVEIVRRANADNLGVVFDPAHYHCTPSKFDQINAASVPFIRHVHVNDMRDKPGELSNCNSDRVLPGQGCLDLRAMFAALEQHGFHGFYSIELFNDELWAMPAVPATKLLYASLLPYCAN